MSVTETDAVNMLLELAKRRLESGSIFDSFSAVLHAIRLTSGEEAIMDILAAAKKKVDVQHESDMNQYDYEEKQIEEAFKMCELLVSETSLLKDQGNEDWLRIAFEDGSSVVCRECQGLIPRERWSAHVEYWCPKRNHPYEDDT